MRDPALVISMIARTVRIHEVIVADQAMTTSVTVDDTLLRCQLHDFFRTQRLLLVFDHLERVIEDQFIKRSHNTALLLGRDADTG